MSEVEIETLVTRMNGAANGRINFYISNSIVFSLACFFVIKYV